MAFEMRNVGALAYGAAAKLEKPPILPCTPATAIDWFDFSQTYNPLGTPESFVAAMHAIGKEGVNVEQTERALAELPQLLAQRFGVGADNIAATGSANEVLAALAEMLTPTAVGIPVPSRDTYRSLFTQAGHDVVDIVNPDGTVTPDPLPAHTGGHAIKAAVLSNPGFPTSRLLPRHTLRAYLSTCEWVVVDERGIDLTLGGESVAEMVLDRPNLIVVASFTDTYSLPGLPLSCAIANPITAARLRCALKAPSSPRLAAAFARLSIAHPELLERTRELCETEIPWMQCMLSLIPGITIFPAEANYVMCAYAPGPNLRLGASDADELVGKLQERGFLVRSLDRTPGIEAGTRFCVSVRTRCDNERFIEAIRGIVSHG